MDLVNEQRDVFTGNDNIVIIDNFQSIRGGRTLDVTGFAPEIINAGHVIIQDDTTKAYKPMPVDAEEYGAIPEDHTVVGILIASVPTKKAFAGIMVRGTVNVKAAPYGLEGNATVLAAVEEALPLILFTHDKA